MTIPISDPWITEHEKSVLLDMMTNGWDNYQYVEKFEKDFARWHDRKYALMTPCCTHALHLILIALGIEEGDEVIIPECTWTGSCAPIVYQRAIPVFADIDKNNWCLTAETISNKITQKTKAIIVVDLYGNMPEMEAIIEIADKNGIYLIEDAAEALGSSYKGVKAGKFGIAGAHSFHRTKTLTTGEGGMLLLDDDRIFERAHFLRDHGRSKTIPYFIEEVAPKYMPSNLAASLGYAQFQRIDQLVSRKQEILHYYKNKFSHLPDITLNTEDSKVTNGAWATTVAFGNSYNFNNHEINKHFEKEGIPFRPFFYPLSSLPAYKIFNNGGQKTNPVSYEVSNRAITLPSSYNITDNQMSQVCDAIIKLVTKK